MMRGPLIAGLLNLVALSALFLGNIGWKCEKGYHEAARKYMTDAPLEFSHHPDNDNDGEIRTREAATATATSNDGVVPSYLQWDASPPEVPKDWSFQTPRSCENITNFDSNGQQHGEQKIIVHFHMQHNAGTSFYSFARRFAPCATRACWQDSKHCLVSYNEEVEAENIRQNYKKYGVQYVSYEMMLPPHFPLPFVSETARRGLFFTTIVRDPFKRFLTYVRGRGFDKDSGARSPFWLDLQGKQNVYSGDNLNARWLSGAQEQISSDHVNAAKCRLQLFDLVIADKLYDYAVKKVMCPLNGWKGKGSCDDEITKEEHKSKPDPLKNSTDPLLIGAWVERLRPSFEIYDYARILSWKQLKERGVKDLPELSEVPSYMNTLANYADMKVTDAHFKKIRRVSLENEDYFSPPVEFCNRMKQVWTSNPDEVPNAYGIGTIMNGFHPKFVGKST
eukprot:CAMPEP_0201891244 /NCGR_PEP_ID=MMETSP0902-20130614/33969_1 /ASSEMBLY_ACC=CAM_ASM_000551 /TAXON_ID=420261 /ORGANISM="Thalassiosira antarctica, Strain CCMP982" /LENGTH=448 /DNA_ID=CAMNT_0048422363 /DNA_START=18 /DNA_END=1364 /DNA_ORIENTATION=+